MLLGHLPLGGKVMLALIFFIFTPVLFFFFLIWALTGFVSLVGLIARLVT